MEVARSDAAAVAARAEMCKRSRWGGLGTSTERSRGYPTTASKQINDEKDFSELSYCRAHGSAGCGDQAMAFRAAASCAAGRCGVIARVRECCASMALTVADVNLRCAGPRYAIRPQCTADGTAQRDSSTQCQPSGAALEPRWITIRGAQSAGANDRHALRCNCAWLTAPRSREQRRWCRCDEPTA